jgi:hypothetical protein
LLRVILEAKIMIPGDYDLISMGQMAKENIEISQVIQFAESREISRENQDVTIWDIRLPISPVGIGKQNQPDLLPLVLPSRH